jgi:hypothetical protein
MPPCSAVPSKKDARGLRAAVKLNQLVCIALVLAAGRGFGAELRPVKLGVEIGSHAPRSGEKVAIQVGLFNAANQPAKAPKPLSVSIQVRLASGAVENLQTVVIPVGESSKRVEASVPGSGLVYVWAKNPELLPGGEFVEVRTAESALSAAKPPVAAPKAQAPLRGIPAAPIAPALPAHFRPQITLRYSPDRQFLADGKDAVTIEAFLIGAEEALAQDIHLNIYDSSNSLKPTPLTISAGQSSGHSALVSSQPGAVTVELLGSMPPAEFQGDKKLDIKFMPPITRLGLQASPPDISLVDTADLIVTLTDEQGRPIATDTPRRVALSMSSGRGRIEQLELQIAAGQFEARTRFVPEWSAPVSVSASTPNLLTVLTPIRVSVPIALFLCSGLGGLVGGLLSRRTRRKPDRWRALIGLATGFLFYWACIFLGLASARREVVLNPLSALALSAIGGWLQTEVFSMIWGVLRPRAKA